MFHNKKKKKTKIELDNVDNVKKEKTDSIIKHPAFKLNFSQTSPLEFSKDLFNEIARYFSAKDFGNVAQVSKTLNNFAQQCPTPFLGSSRFGTYAEQRSMHLMDNAQINLFTLLKNLREREERTFLIPVWVLVLLFGIKIYLAAESYFIYKNFHDDEFHVERNVTRCIELNKNDTQEAVTQFTKHGCYDRPQVYVFVTPVFGVMYPLFLFMIALLAKGFDWKIPGPVVKVSKNEWEPLLAEITYALDQMEAIMPSLAENNSDLKENLKKLNKKKIPITNLKRTLKTISKDIKETKESFGKTCFFKHSSKNKPQESQINGDVRINIPQGP